MLLSFVQFLFRSCDQYRTSMQKAHITNNNEIIVLAHSRVVMQESILSLPIPPPGHSREFASNFCAGAGDCSR